ncbi:cation transport ATPase [endosymbiont of Acanthamoeba sp. UWC8]|uniref:heavy metal translocating P-type ATPase n=1 Tax=endosymbiont of Acanthamoeba sp. UWC8 TaxID=86106 RepID=UPI0004D11C45|nr:heavy metal translocating P-type ATPase metal-binding domain-containing protein [endosymbiont of Acanthamoeba sp. UWC8]AIF80682.1 cation transport ATPase [endosymbiont of Acanthamoeba sp. UWC8]
MKNNKKCLHCQLDLSKSQRSFCCFGCEAAYNLINKLNLKDYYKFCKNIYNTSPMKVEEVKNELNYVESAIYNKDKQQHEINLLVEGVHCGSCIWLIESTLKQQGGVKLARINISTQRLLLAWEGEEDIIYKYVDIIQKLGYKLIPFDYSEFVNESDKRESFLLKSIAVSGFATIQLMMIVMGIWFAERENSMGENTRNLLHLISMIVAVPAILYSGLPFFKSAFEALKAGRSNMDVPISLGIIATTLISIWEFIRGGAYTYFDSAAMLIFALLVGRYLDIKSRNKAKEKARELILRQAKTVTLVEGNKLKLLPISKVKIGDIIHVSVGEKIPVDGVVVEGSSEADNSIITGETLPVIINKGMNVFSGTINLLAPIKVEIKKLGDSTILGEIIKLIENAEQGRAKYVRIADKVAGLYTPAVLLLSVLTFLMWYLLGSKIDKAVLNAVAVLIITCPCALGLAVPVVQIIASSRMMSLGILIKSRDALERLSQVDTIIFDKTGTLTLGEPSFINPNNLSELEINIISSLAAQSKHPLCKAILKEFKGEIIPLEVNEEKGMGLKSSYNGEAIKLGNKKWCNVKNSDEYDDIYSEMWFKRGEREPIRLKFSDLIRDEAKNVIKVLKDEGYEIWLLSGDRKKAVEHVAHLLNIKNYKAECKPQEKYNFIENLHKAGKLSAMIGDGLNDSPALKRAHASMSPSSAIDLSQNIADIVFQSNLKAILQSINTAKKSNVLVKQNFIISFIYNIVSIPIAAFGFITPLFAAITMSVSSICVILNSLRLNKKDSI